MYIRDRNHKTKINVYCSFFFDTNGRLSSTDLEDATKKKNNKNKKNEKLKKKTKNADKMKRA